MNHNEEKFRMLPGTDLIGKEICECMYDTFEERALSIRPAPADLIVINIINSCKY